MSSKPENQFIRGVHKYVPPEVYHMKNHNAYVSGIPDVWYSDVYDLWVEYKFCPVKSFRAPVVPDLSGQQFRWIRDRKAQGRNVWTIVGLKTGGIIFESIEEMEHGIPAEKANELIIPRKDVAQAIVQFVLQGDLA